MNPLPNTPTDSRTNTLQTPLLARLREFLGRYHGQGVNHAGEAFRADFLVDDALDGNLVELRFRASDADHSFHEERTWITEDLMTQQMAMWTISSNTPGVLRLELIEDSSDSSYLLFLTFRLGDPDDDSRFRQQIQIGLRRDQAVEYIYSWGVPHEPFGVKSKVLLKRSQT